MITFVALFAADDNKMLWACRNTTQKKPRKGLDISGKIEYTSKRYGAALDQGRAT